MRVFKVLHMVTLKNEHEQQSDSVYNEVVKANKEFVATYTAQEDAFAHKYAAVLTCMDARLLPNEFMGFKAGDMHLIRNAGGRASDDAIRSLVISSQLLKTNQFFVVHHTGCGMERFTNKSVQEFLENTVVDKDLIATYCNAFLSKVQNGKNDTCDKKSCVNYQCIDWLTIEHGLFESVLEDVQKIRNHPLIASYIPIYGFIFDVITGQLIPVDKAMKAGKAK